MGQSQQRTTQAYKGRHCRQIHKNMLHALPHFSILAQASQIVAVPVLDLVSKSLPGMLDIYRYYSARSKYSSSAAVKILQLEITNSSDRDITAFLAESMSQPQKKIENNKITCSLNIFESYCQRTIADPMTFRGKLTLYVEYYSNNLELQCTKRKDKGKPFSERQIVEMLAVVVREAKKMTDNKFKEPLLSPKGIKIDQKGGYRVGEWECTHYIEGEGEEETGFAEEGQTLLMIQGQKGQEEEKQEYDILGHYYWPPEGTNAMKNLTRIGVNPPISSSQPKGQVFSLGMTVLHLLLQRPLYQPQTYSEQTIQHYFNQAIQYREESKLSLSSEFTCLLRQMLMWNPKERISYGQLQRRLDELIQIDTVRGDIPSASMKSVRIPLSGSLRVPVTTSVRVTVSSNSGRDVEGSGSIDQGEGDEVHPEEEIPCEKNQNTTRGKTQEYSIDYQKIDYTIRRERKEWQMFQNRLSTSQSCDPFENDLRNNLSLTAGTFPCELLEEDEEDSPSHEILCLTLPDNRKEKEVTDQEEGALVGTSQRGPTESNVADQIKLLDISNIKARQASSKNLGKNRSSSNPRLFNQMFFDNEESFSTLLHGKNINIQAFMNQSDSLLLRSSTSPQLNKPAIIDKQEKRENQNGSEENSGLFTSPELMAFIRESTYKPKDNSRKTSSRNIQPTKKECQRRSKRSCSFVKEEFAKGWYQGGKIEGLRNGYGTFHYNEGGKYCGDWLNSQMHGRGTLYYADGRIAYQGEWECDSLNGIGILYNETPRKINTPFDYRNFNNSEDVWVYYEGSFVNDDKNGHGVLLLTNGERFEGSFKGDLVDGRGTFYCGNGEVIRGLWRGNRFVEAQSVGGGGQQKQSLRGSLQK